MGVKTVNSYTCDVCGREPREPVSQASQLALRAGQAYSDGALFGWAQITVMHACLDKWLGQTNADAMLICPECQKGIPQITAGLSARVAMMRTVKG